MDNKMKIPFNGKLSALILAVLIQCFSIIMHQLHLRDAAAGAPLPGYIIAAEILSAALMLLSLSIAYISDKRKAKKTLEITSYVNSAEPLEPLNITPTNIQPLDILSDSFRAYCEKSFEASKILSSIMSISSLPVGCYEKIWDGQSKVYVSNTLLNLLGIKNHSSEEFLTQMDWMRIGEKLTSDPELSMKNVYKWTHIATYSTKWLRIESETKGNIEYGVIFDITEEVMKLHELKFETSYDSMTSLLNRKGFKHAVIELMNSSPDKTGVMIFADLDNLKGINDTHGHDFGDQYIRTAAEMFSSLQKIGGLVARNSGDEFIMYVHGFSSKDEAREILRDFIKNNFSSNLRLPNGEYINISYSMGLSWYPNDSKEVSMLIKFADYAMYEAKNTQKGQSFEFNKDAYLENSHLYEKSEALDELIEKELVSYVFQPIYDTRHNMIYGYEAFMRPSISEFRTPMEILTIASLHSKLYDLEKITIRKVLEWVDKNINKLRGKKIFINTLVNQTLDAADMAEINRNYSHLYQHLIFEITEIDSHIHSPYATKINIIREVFNAKVAIDDIGSNSINALHIMKNSPDIVKIDRNSINGLITNLDKQALVSNFITYCHDRDIIVLAESVETEEEYLILSELGVDMMQGYFIGMPTPDISDINLNYFWTLNNHSYI